MTSTDRRRHPGDFPSGADNPAHRGAGEATRFQPGNEAAAKKFSPEVCEQIVTAVAAGAYMDTAAAFAGISKKTFFEWMKRGRAGAPGDEEYAKFVADIEEALANSEMQDLAFISRARGEHWQAAAWKLERRYPDKYGRKTRIDGNVNVTARPFIDTSKLSAEELETLAALLEKGRPDLEDPALGIDGKPAADLLQIEAAEEEAEEAEWEEVEAS